MSANELWTDQELAVSVMAYRLIQALEASAAEFTKSGVRNFVLDEVGLDRSKSSFERRMGNISSVLEERGAQWIDGYIPMENVGSKIAYRIGRLLDEFPLQLPTSE